MTVEKKKKSHERGPKGDETHKAKLPSRIVKRRYRKRTRDERSLGLKAWAQLKTGCKDDELKEAATIWLFNKGIV